ncbi:MAG: D-glycero-beta-D-manno-heptose 1-phosphate adenylyltransferase [Candidatus Aminicenantes bacterium]|nr:D-glycero-beta-D-manno-heptose 1-phosphate adenylyltransferase [Candidatus Aminicenantes bacterium]
MKRKIFYQKELKAIVKRYQQKGKTVVFTNGCFDLLHGGHVFLFQKAKKEGDILIVALNEDDSVRRLKGPARPVFPLKERLEILSALEDIDYLTSFPEDTPRKIVSFLLPDVLVKGGDWGIDEIIGRREVEAAGGKVVRIPYLKGSSTTEIIERIKKTRS